MNSDSGWLVEDLEEDSSPGLWISPATANRPVVGGLVPNDKAAFVRIFHPAGGRSPVKPTEVTPVRWQKVAEDSGRAVHGGMQWGSIIRAEGDPLRNSLWDVDPDIGRLPLTEANVLASILKHFTGTPDECWFGFWAGHNFEGIPQDAGRLNIFLGPVLLFKGPVRAAVKTFVGQRPSIWWPADREWCVATDPDLMSTFVAGSEQCISRIIEADDLEAMAISPTLGLAWNSDDVNPQPPRAYRIS